MLNTTISKPANLWAYYNFDNGVAGGTNTGLTTLTDNSGNLHTGTLSNFTLTGATSNWIESYSMVVPVPTAATTIMQTGFTANWTAPAVGTVDNNYRLDVSTSPTFASFVTGYNGLTVAGTSQSVTGLTAGTTYYYRVRADKTSVTGQGGYHFTTINATTLTALPVQITEITAQLLNNKTAVVKWISATEINLSNYDIQRSNDGTNFSTVGTVAAKGSGAYSFNDDLGNAGVLPATIYYRLKAVDKDASKMYSKVVAVSINTLKASITIYPNPVQAILYINISAIKDNAAQLRIVDMQGKIVATQNAKLVAGTTLLTIPTIWLAAGSYTLDIITPDGKQSQRFIKE